MLRDSGTVLQPGVSARVIAIVPTALQAIPQKLTAGLLFVETSSLTGENASTPFLLAARSILAAIDAGTLDPDGPSTGVSYGERQLRAVGSNSHLRGTWSSRVRRRDSISIREMVGERKCAC